jgi:hypothetical protein
VRWPWHFPRARHHGHQQTVRVERKLCAALDAQEAATRDLLEMLAGLRAARGRKGRSSV